ncbi:MAG: hypothetical protein C0487_18845 [Leptothrix sp. (in: Bacteria)]|nr:hypothetical protein [Leptothrix sp. (in: b-proteobacteria)]
MISWQGKGGSRAAFFSLAVWCCFGWVWPGLACGAELALDHHVAALQTAAHDKSLAAAPAWAALLHLDHGQPTVDDPSFLLSSPRFSARRELDETIAALYGPRSSEMVCRFPARYAWLRLVLMVPELSLAHCDDLQEFLRRAPADRISLVFASENLAQPSSMMGHVFLKVDGLDAKGIQRDHAISFFTDAATFNLPKLMFDSLVVGKKGYFALSPYAEEVMQYVMREQRTLWEYELRLDTDQRMLLRYHLIELKQSSFTYFFHRHNCATLIKHILALAAPEVLRQRSWIDTPKDVVKLADQAGVVADTTVRAPSRWRVRTIDAVLPGQLSSQVRRDVQALRTDFVKFSEPASHQAHLSIELAGAYNEHLHEKGERSVADWQTYRDVLAGQLSQAHAGLSVEATSRKNPSESPQDSQVRAGLKHQHGRRYLTLGVLPVSHTMDDDNEQYFGESELRLFDAGLTLDLASGRVGLDRFTVYAAKSVLSRDAFTGGWSGQFKVGWEHQADRSLDDRTAFLFEGGLGVAYRPWPDIDVYALFNAGLGARQRAYAYLNPVIGAVVREVYGMKSQLTVSHVDRPLGREDGVTELAFTQSKYLDGGFTLMLQLSRRFASGRQADTVSATVKRLF